MKSNVQAVVVMGVSGCGKSTVGRYLADHLGYVFLDADDFHPAGNIEKMRAGVPLSDADRAPWLARLVQLLDDQLAKGRGVVLACSALKARYRRRLSAGRAVPRFVYLEGTPEVIAARMKARDGHFMPASLLESQFEALEAPRSAIRVAVDQPLEAVVTQALAGLE